MAGAFDNNKIDEAVLALFFLSLHDDGRAWKGVDWDSLSRLHKQGMIENPVRKQKSVVLTPAGLKASKQLFETMFTKPK